MTAERASPHSIQLMNDAPDVAALAARWNALPGSVCHMRDGANAVFRFRSDTHWRFLRVTEDRHRNREQLGAELDFLRFLASQGLAVVAPVPSNRNDEIETVRTPDGRIWHTVVFAAAPGRRFRYFSSDIDQPLFHIWGAAMGRLHALSREYTPAASRRRPAWSDQDTTRCTESMIPGAEVSARREHARISEWLKSLPRTRETWGRIHGDFERTNFVLDGAVLRVYDFDDACYHWYMADVAHALWAFRNAPAADRGRFLAWFMEGYEQQSAVPHGVREYLSWFVRLPSLCLFLRRRPSPTCAEMLWAQRMRAGLEKPIRW
jgi:Ser/Thr protein kinase RdoA (MazF antagonist)